MNVALFKEFIASILMSYLFIFKYIENVFTLVKHAYKLEIFQENKKGSVK